MGISLEEIQKANLMPPDATRQPFARLIYSTNGKQFWFRPGFELLLAMRVVNYLNRKERDGRDARALGQGQPAPRTPMHQPPQGKPRPRADQRPARGGGKG